MGVLTAADRQVPRGGSVICDDEQELFVIPQGGGGWSCYGYSNCEAESKKLAQAIGRPDLAPTDAHFGTLAGYELHGTLTHLLRNSNFTGTWYDADTPDEVKRAMEPLIGRDTRVRITYGDPKTGEAWGDEPETGTIGRTGGAMKAPILVKTRRSHGGGAIMTGCIVRMESEGRTLYRHPTFHMAPARPAQEPAALAAPMPDILEDLAGAYAGQQRDPVF